MGIWVAAAFLAGIVFASGWLLGWLWSRRKTRREMEQARINQARAYIHEGLDEVVLMGAGRFHWEEKEENGQSTFTIFEAIPGAPSDRMTVSVMEVYWIASPLEKVRYTTAGKWWIRTNIYDLVRVIAELQAFVKQRAGQVQEATKK